ncbi:MAG TPA: PLP-dependent aminotransferase family protein [Candidatus Acidoferrum sp.]|jgi:GntR family transcriptional regulator/MocR family aminotransferase
MKRVSASFLPPIALDASRKIPMYRQLYEWFRRAILAGQLQPGQRVPSTRSLAAELSVSRVPVSIAYEQLQSEGYFEAFVGAGTCVARSIPAEALKLGVEEFSRNQRRGSSKSAPRTISRRVALMRLPPQTWSNDLVPFRVSLPALECFPAGIWSKLLNRNARKQSRQLMAYGDAKGYLPFREAVAEYLGTVRAVRCDASQVLVTTGSQQGIQLSAQVLLNANDRIWIEEPGYPGARQALLTAGAKLVPVPVDEDGLRVAEGIRRSRRARAAYITPSHQYPLGVTMNAARRMLLLNWASHHGAWIIEDDYDSEYRFAGRPIPSLQGLDRNGRVTYVGTFSKVMFPALRLGYLVVPKDLVNAFAVVRDASDQFSSTLYQAVMTDFIREGHFARHIRRMRTLYLERRTALVEVIHKYLGEKLEVIGAEAGMHLVALLPPGVSDVAISRKAAAMGLSVMPLSSCCVKRPVRSGLILGYGGTDVRQIQDGMRRLSACF